MKDPVFQLCDRIRETSFSLHSHLRHGHVEKVYENGLANRLRKQNLLAQQQRPLNVLDEDGILLGEFLCRSLRGEPIDNRSQSLPSARG